MAVALNTLYPSLRLELPGVIEPALADAVSEAVQEFFKRSEVWKYTADNLLDWTTAAVFPTPVAGTDIPADTRIVRVDQVKYASNGKDLDEVLFVTRGQLDRLYPDWEVKTGDTPLRWTNDAPGTHRIIPIATANVTGSLQLRVVVAPTNALTSLPDFLFYEFKDIFKLGALGRLMKIPGKDWTNIRAASSYIALFDNEIIKAKSRAQAEFGHARREVTYGGI